MVMNAPETVILSTHDLLMRFCEQVKSIGLSINYMILEATILDLFTAMDNASPHEYYNTITSTEFLEEWFTSHPRELARHETHMQLVAAVTELGVELMALCQHHRIYDPSAKDPFPFVYRDMMGYDVYLYHVASDWEIPVEKTH